MIIPVKIQWTLSRPIKHGCETEIVFELENGGYADWEWLNQSDYGLWTPKYQKPFYDSLGKMYLRAPTTGDISVHLELRASNYGFHTDVLTVDFPHENCRRCSFRGFLRSTRIVI